MVCVNFGLGNKRDNPYLVTFLIKTPIFEWYVLWCGFKNILQKDMFPKNIALCVQNMITIMNSTININGGTYMTI